ncbi:putative F-box domain-containing protein [Tanacetum coccineum]
MSRLVFWAFLLFLSLSDLCYVNDSARGNDTLDSICLGSQTLPPFVYTTKKPRSGSNAPPHLPPPPQPLHPTSPSTITKPSPANNAYRHDTTKPSALKKSNKPVFDIVEDILVRLDGEDLLRCKSVCKSWLSFISSSRFVNTHLEYNHKKDLNNSELGNRRIIIPRYSNTLDNGKVLDFSEYWSKNCQLHPRFPRLLAGGFYLGVFGYDSLTDDYKVVIGTRIKGKKTLFQVLTLKSNLWKVTGQVNWRTLFHPFGILWKGALHWFMKDCNGKKVILSFDISREQFKEFPQPDDSSYVCNSSNSLGIADGFLCIYRNHPPYQRWVMKSNNDKQSWKLLQDDCEKNTYDIAHALKDYKSRNNWGGARVAAVGGDAPNQDLAGTQNI